MTQREQILTKANKIVNGARNEAYGTPEDNFKRIAVYWSSYLDKYDHEARVEVEIRDI